MAKIVWHDKEFEKIRKAPSLHALFHQMGTPWAADLNADLNAAEIKRGQPVEDGYKFYVTELPHEVRLFMVAFTARAQAHEAKHSSMLKLMRTAGRTVVRGKAENPRED